MRLHYFQSCNHTWKGWLDNMRIYLCDFLDGACRALPEGYYVAVQYIETKVIPPWIWEPTK